MWKMLFQSVAGTSHERGGTPCQDSCHATRIESANEEFIIIACADGAGSAAMSEVGAKLACEEFIRLASAHVAAAPLTDLSDEIFRDWYKQVVVAVEARAEGLSTTSRQLACTLLTGVVGSQRAWFAQVGDGGVVFARADKYEVLFWPQTGEFANTTTFVTDPTAMEEFEFATLERIDEFAVFTDGLQRLALDFSTKAAHEPFFAPMFKALRAAAVVDELQAPLIGFLSSDAVNKRTDDDKTLFLATRLSDVPLSVN